jgi:hypothetical protein
LIVATSIAAYSIYLDGRLVSKIYVFLLIYTFLLFVLVYYFIKTPILIFNENNIIKQSIFKKQTTYNWNDLVEIFLSNKEPGVLLTAQKYEATTLRFNNGESIILWNDTYAGLSKIRQLIVEKAKDKIKDPISEIRNSTLQF